jgi:Ca-activated chloride channel homolog
LIGFCGYSKGLLAQVPQQPIPSKARILFLLDGSGSMNTPWDGDLRINVAKRKLANLVDSMKNNAKVEFALNHAALKQKVFSIQPKGITPIAYSLEQATKDFPNDPNGEYRNIIIMITDGVESCKGDPCAISIGLQRKGIFLKPFIIGLGVGKDFGKAFECIGKAFDARSGGEFGQLLGTIIRQSIGKTTITVELLDNESRAVEKDVNMTFYNSITGKAVYELVHYRDKKGKTDTLQIDPLATYDLIINTIPQVRKEDITGEGGRHNTISVKTPQGTLNLQMKSASEYATPLIATIRQNGKTQTIHNQKIGDTEKYLVGKYEIEIPTIPRTILKDIEIKQGETNTVQIGQPAVLNLKNLYDGFLSFYRIDETTAVQEWVYNLDIEGSTMNVTMQAGKYKMVFRAKEAQGSNYTIIKTFSLSAGGAATVDILK